MRRDILLSEICSGLGLQYTGDDIAINGLNLCNRISRYDHIISYVMDGGYVAAVEDNLAIKVLLVPPDILEFYSESNLFRKLAYIICDNPEQTFYDIHEYLYRCTDFYEKYEFRSVFGTDCSIAESAVIEFGVILGNRVKIGANTVVRRGTVIEDDCEIGCNNTIGSEGFQVLRNNGKNRKAIHVGGLRICSGTWIGDNNTVCNSLFEGETYIGKNVKIDNLVHVGHNGYVGDNAVVTAGTILCGSAVVEDGAWIGVNSSVLNKVTVGRGSKIGIGSVVTRNVPEGSLAYGVPAKTKIIMGGAKRKRKNKWNICHLGHKNGHRIQHGIRSPAQWDLHLLGNRQVYGRGKFHEGHILGLQAVGNKCISNGRKASKGRRGSAVHRQGSRVQAAA